MSSPNPIHELIYGDVLHGKDNFVGWFKRHTTPYHLTVAAVLGGITAVFFAVIALLIIVALNFNVLGWME